MKRTDKREVVFVTSSNPIDWRRAVFHYLFVRFEKCQFRLLYKRNTFHYLYIAIISDMMSM